MADFAITSRFVSKDPEYEVTYVERVDGAERRIAFRDFVDELEAGPLERWDSPDAPLDAADRERVLDRLIAWSRPSPRRITGASGEALRLPGAYAVDLPTQERAQRVIYREVGRTTQLWGRRMRGRGPRFWLASVAPWQPSGAAVTPAELAVIRERIAADFEDPAAPGDPWSLARDLDDWTGCVGLMPRSDLIAAVYDGSAPPPVDTIFWSHEFPALRQPRLGWNLAADSFRLAPVAAATLAQLREWLFARAGVIVERGDAGVLGVYVDGSARFSAPAGFVVVEPGMAPAITPLIARVMGLARDRAAGAPRGRDASPLAPGAFRVTARAGVEIATLAPDPALLAAAGEVVRHLIEATDPRVL